jgi:hypothetical protein
VPILENASNAELRRLLELFPIADVRHAWPHHKGTKEDLCEAVADTRKYEEIADFIDANFSCCKQHIYIYSRGESSKHPPRAIPGGERIRQARAAYSLYIAKSCYKVVLDDPFEIVTIDFLWPIRMDVIDGYLIVRFVTLQKNLRTYFERSHIGSKRTGDERAILASVEDLAVEPADLHKGVKKLWDDGFMDASRAKYKKPTSTAWEAMDQARGIKAHNPALYRSLQTAVLHDLFFRVLDRGTTVSAVLANPSEGYLAFPRYTDKKGDTDLVISEILRCNQ